MFKITADLEKRDIPYSLTSVVGFSERSEPSFVPAMPGDKLSHKAGVFKVETINHLIYNSLLLQYCSLSWFKNPQNLPIYDWCLKTLQMGVIHLTTLFIQTETFETFLVKSYQEYCVPPFLLLLATIKLCYPGLLYGTHVVPLLPISNWTLNLCGHLQRWPTAQKGESGLSVK